MNLRHRPMRPRDVSACVAIVAAHPELGPRYGNAIEDLKKAWFRLLEYEAKTAVVFEEVGETSVRILGSGVSAFVSDDFIRELKQPPFFWIGPELARRIARGASPVLSDRELRDANACGGLNLLTWEGCVLPEDIKRPDVYNKVMTVFMEEHRGYLWKEVIGTQAETGERLLSMIKSGGILLNPNSGKWDDAYTGDPQEIIKRPHIIGSSREVETRRPGSLVGMLFDHQPARLGFSASEQRLLQAAQRGLTDEELSAELEVSLSAVKKAWRMIYERVEASLPGLIPANLSAGDSMPQRAREKKRQLMVYLRDHPEELRPVSRKLLRQTQPRSYANAAR
jgi:DNA-binding CsgD family transcriptional regulator